MSFDLSLITKIFKCTGLLEGSLCYLVQSGIRTKITLVCDWFKTDFYNVSDCTILMFLTTASK